MIYLKRQKRSIKRVRICDEFEMSDKMSDKSTAQDNERIVQLKAIIGKNGV